MKGWAEGQAASRQPDPRRRFTYGLEPQMMVAPREPMTTVVVPGSRLAA